jgi:uncharacterized protein YndB with AHSA1/START domain
VFGALVTPASVAAWFWPPRFQTQVAMEARPGGDLSIRSAPVGMGVTGVYEAVEEPAALVFSWRWDGEETQSRVAIALSPAAGGTRLRLVQSGLDPGAVENHVQGWNDCLERLQDWLLAQRDG